MFVCKKIKNGLWECRGEASPHPETGKRRQLKRRGRTKKVAQTRLRNALKLLDDHYIDLELHESISFRDLANDWLEHYKLTGVRPNSIRIRSDHINILNKHIGAKPFARLQHRQFQLLINKLSQRYAINSIKNIRTTLNLIGRHAVLNKVVISNPVADVYIPNNLKTPVQTEAKGFYDTEELQLFLEAVNLYGLELDRERFYLFAFTGLRNGELCALKIQDIDFHEKTLRVNKTLRNKTGNIKNYEIGPPKTAGSNRIIHLNESLLKMLERLVHRYNHYKKMYGSKFHDEHFLFCRYDGYPYHQLAVNLRMQRLLKKTNIDKLTPHGLRHTHISLLAEAGVDLPTIMQRVGHEDVNTTMKIYTHVTENMKKTAVHKLSQEFRDLLDNDFTF